MKYMAFYLVPFFFIVSVAEARVDPNDTIGREEKNAVQTAAIVKAYEALTGLSPVEINPEVQVSEIDPALLGGGKTLFDRDQSRPVLKRARENAPSGEAQEK